MRARFTLFAGAFLVTLLFVFVPRHAHAQWWTSGIYSIVGEIMFGISYLVSFIAGIGIVILAWALQVVLSINLDIANSPPVQAGFPIMLSLANLAFVLAIIVIAIMTILRSETYGVKKALLRLIIMAVLVNFSLVLAGAVVNLADQFSIYFLSCIDPAGGGCGRTGNAVESFDRFALAFSGAFNPQKGLIIRGDISQFADNFQGSFVQGGANISKLLTPITSVVFSLLGSILFIIVFLALVVMLAIRYIYISILLILAPLAFTGWVFPATEGYWKKWWDKLIKQAFFAPLVLFFLWVTFKTAEALGSPDNPYSFERSPAALEAAAGSGFLTPIFAHLMQMGTLLGLMVGGLFAAHSLGIKFADTAIKTAGGVTKGLAGWAGRKTAGVVARSVSGAPATTRFGRYMTTGWRQYTNPMSLVRLWGTRTTFTPQLQAFGTRMRASPGLLASLATGAAVGSGYYKPVKNWQCQNCITTTGRNTVVQHKGKPGNAYLCPVCHQSTTLIRTARGPAGASYENWVKV